MALVVAVGNHVVNTRCESGSHVPVGLNVWGAWGIHMSNNIRICCEEVIGTDSYKAAVRLAKLSELVIACTIKVDADQRPA